LRGNLFSATSEISLPVCDPRIVLTTKRPNGQETQTYDQKCHSTLLLHFTARLESPHLFGLSGRSRIALAASSSDFRGPDGSIEMNFSQVWARRCLDDFPGGKFCAPSRKEGAKQDIEKIRMRACPILGGSTFGLQFSRPISQARL